MKKTFLQFILVLSLLMGLIGCPNNPDTGNGNTNDQTEQTQEEKNKAASGLEKDMTVIGKIEDTTCDITLNAENGTFTASKSSRSDEASYSGEFFYYNGKLQLMVTSKNDQRLSMADTFCLTATLEEEVLTNNETVVFETQEVTTYETAKEEFRSANPIKTFSLAGMRFYSEDLHVSSTMTMNGKDTTSDGISKAFFDFTENSVYSNFFNTGSGAASMSYTLSGDKITMIVDINETITSVGSTGEIQTKLVAKGTLTGKLSADKKSISITGDCLSTSSAGTISMSQTVSYNGTFTKSNAAVYLGGKTYTATSAKIGGKDVGNASSIKLKFIDKYNAEFINGTQTINIFKSAPYLVNETVVIQTSSLTIDGQNYYGNLTGTLSSDKNTIAINCNLQTLDDNDKIVEVPFVWTFKLDSSSTSTTIPSGNDIDPSLLSGMRFVADVLTMVQIYGEQQSPAVTESGCVLDFTTDNKVMLEPVFSSTGQYMTYSVTGNTLKIELNYDPNAGTEYAGMNGYTANITGTISDDGSKITNFSGEFEILRKTQNNQSENISFSFSNGTFTNKGTITAFTGKTYKATKAKCDDENMTGNIELVFTDTYAFTIKQDGSSIIRWCNYYLVTGDQINLSAMWNVNNTSVSGILRGTISSDYSTFSVSADMSTTFTSTKDDGTTSTQTTTMKLEFDFVLDSDSGNNTDTTTTIPSGDITNVYIGKTYLIEMSNDSASSQFYILTFQSETSCTFSAFGSNSIQFDGSALSMTDASNDIHQLGTITFDEGYSSLTMVITDGPNGQPITLTGTVYEGQSGNDEPIPEGTLSNNFDLAGTRYYCDELTFRQEYMNDQIMQVMQNKYADVLNFKQDNSADAGNLGGYEFTYTEAVNENKVVLTSSYNGYIGALVGTISSDNKTIEISGTLKARMSDTVELFLTYKGTYHKIETELFTLDGKTYTSTSAKLNNAAITDGVVYTLTFGDRDFRLQDNKQEISTNSIYYGVYSNITNTQIYTRGSSERDYRNYFFDDLNMTISSDKKTVIITANVSTHGQNETLIGEQEITFSLNE